jgi:hypothetical protein
LRATELPGDADLDLLAQQADQLRAQGQGADDRVVCAVGPRGGDRRVELVEQRLDRSALFFLAPALPAKVWGVSPGTQSCRYHPGSSAAGGWKPLTLTVSERQDPRRDAAARAAKMR